MTTQSHKLYMLPVTFQELMELETSLKQSGNTELLKKIKQFADTHFPEQLDSEHTAERM